MVGGTVADVWRMHFTCLTRIVLLSFSSMNSLGTADRGLPMSVYAVSVLFPIGLAPVIAGWIENNPRLGWRWIGCVCVLNQP